MLSRFPSKATGSDGIPSLLNKSAIILAEPIHHLLIESFHPHKFPSKWRIADVVAVPKWGEIAVTNVRPISQLSIPAKLVERIILLNLKDRVPNLLGKYQYGRTIRKKSPKTHAIITVHDLLTKYADDPNNEAFVFISFDFTKAFDKINHVELLIELRNNEFLHRFYPFYDGLCQLTLPVWYNGLKSDLRSATGILVMFLSSWLLLFSSPFASYFMYDKIRGWFA